MRRPFPAVALACLLVLGGGAAGAEVTAELELSTDVAMWNDHVVATITGTGCSGEIGGPSDGFEGGVGLTIDIDLEGCNPSSSAPFTATVPLGPLPVGVRTVRVFDAIRHIVSPPPPPHDTAPLTVFHEASVAVEVPRYVAAGEAVDITLEMPVSSSCFWLEEVQVIRPGVLETSFGDECPILPAGGPHVFRETLTVGPLAPGRWEVRFYEDIPFQRRLRRVIFEVVDPASCIPSDTTLCLAGRRFAVTASWRDFAGRQGVGHALPLEELDASGLLWFFSPDNVELTVKVLEGCGLGGHWWVFLSSGSTVEYEVTVRDTLTGRQKTYRNDLFEVAPLVTDTAAFACDR